MTYVKQNIFIKFKKFQAASERCIQETLNEYCKRLGLLDDQTVPGENAAYEDYNYARFSVVDDKWVCYKSILTGDAAASRIVQFFGQYIIGKHQQDDFRDFLRFLISVNET